VAVGEGPALLLEGTGGGAMEGTVPRGVGSRQGGATPAGGGWILGVWPIAGETKDLQGARAQN